MLFLNNLRFKTVDKKFRVLGTRHTGVICQDLLLSKRFYVDILGFEIIQEFTDKSDYISVITDLEDCCAYFFKLRLPDNSILELLNYPSHSTKHHKLPIHNVGLHHIALEVSSAESSYKFLKDHNVSILSKPVVSSEGFAKVFFCLDPDGNRVEIVEIGS